MGFRIEVPLEIREIVKDKLEMRKKNKPPPKILSASSSAADLKMRSSLPP